MKTFIQSLNRPSGYPSCKRSLSLLTGSIMAVVVLQTPPALADASSSKGPAWGQGHLAVQGGGCPIETPDARSLMFASGRPGGLGDIDIWTVDRTEIGAEWSDAKNLSEPVNSDAADFCPSPTDRTLLFVSTRVHPGACGGADIYMSRQSPAGDWSEPEHLPCAPEGPNTAATERSPSIIESKRGTFLFFSSAGEAGDDDIFVSTARADGSFGPGRLVRRLSTPGYQDQMPTIRKRSAWSFEITFNSDRPGTDEDPAYGGQDAYWAKARVLPFWWSKPRNAGPNVNTLANETRASLSADLQRLYVGRGDIYVSEREE